jgi:hypothetical protein
MTFKNSFTEDIKFLFNKLKNKHHFSFSKYADGEYKVLRNELITNCDNWTFNPEYHQLEHQYLLDSYYYSDPEYYVGISCPCCQPESHIQWMRDNVKSKNITWANLFVNANYEYFKNNFFSEFNNWEGEVTLVANKQGENKKLPFKIDNYLPIQIGSWFNPSLEHIINLLKEKAIEFDDQLFLFSGGPLGNILAHQLHLVNKNNTYLDIGSTINPWIVGNNRGYLKNNNNRNRICIW